MVPLARALARRDALARPWIRTGGAPGAGRDISIRSINAATWALKLGSGIRSSGSKTRKKNPQSETLLTTGSLPLRIPKAFCI